LSIYFKFLYVSDGLTDSQKRAKGSAKLANVTKTVKRKLSRSYGTLIEEPQEKRLKENVKDL
jgi:hypothetical protein